MQTLSKTLSCRRARRHLALLAGDRDGRDSGLDFDRRRRVERHLIGCASCRAERDGLESAVSVLRAAASAGSGRPDAPTIWHDLDREIRASRHAPRPSWRSDPFGVSPGWGLAAGFLFLGGVIGLTGGWHLGTRSANRPRASSDPVARYIPRPALPAGPQPRVLDDADPGRTDPVLAGDSKAINPSDPMRSQ